MKNKIDSYIQDEIKKHGTLCFPLIDSENSTDAVNIAKKVEEIGASAILIGGSSVFDQFSLFEIINKIKSEIKIPVILFPGNITGVSPNADAILFSSLLNSENPYFITGAQALGSLAVKKYDIEPLPTAYLIIGEGTSAWFVGRARGIPYGKPSIGIMYSLAAQYLGMRYLYLEAGSGSKQHVPIEMINAVRKYYEGTLIVGGGIKDETIAKSISDAGANIIVIGTLIEKETNWIGKLESIIKAIRE